MKRILAILGDYYHDEGIFAQALNHAIQGVIEYGNQAEVEYITVDQLVEKLQDRPDAVILSKANKLNPTEKHVKNWMNKIIEKEICQFVKDGGGWLVWHSGLSSYENLDAYYSMVRGKFDFHPAEHQIVTYKSTENPNLIKGMARFEVIDEHYFVSCDEQNTNIFLEVSSKVGNSIAGWSHEYGKGRVVCITPAHTKEGLLHRGMTVLLSKSIQWCCRII